MGANGSAKHDLIKKYHTALSSKLSFDVSCEKYPSYERIIHYENNAHANTLSDADLTHYIDMIVESDCVRIDGHVSVVKDGEIVYFDPVTHDPLYSIAYGFSGVSNDSWEIHLYPGTCNE